MNIFGCQKRVAFTLAEVLITLGIIGVVAAMTMPSVISNYQQKQYEAKYAKAKNVMANGINLMMAQNNVFDVADLPIVSCTDNACRDAELAKVFKSYQGGIDPSTLPQKYKSSREKLKQAGDDDTNLLLQNINDVFFPAAHAMKVDHNMTVIGGEFSWTEPDYIFRVQDGIVFGIKVVDESRIRDTDMAEEMETYSISTQKLISSGNKINRADDDPITTTGSGISINVYVDINGSKSPNAVGKDLYKFSLSGKNKFEDITDELNGGVLSLLQ